MLKEDPDLPIIFKWTDKAGDQLELEAKILFVYSKDR